MGWSSATPYNGTSVSGKDYAFGWAVNGNLTAEVAKGYRLVLQGFASTGAGRYIGGLAPDVIVKPHGSISPIHSYSGGRRIGDRSQQDHRALLLLERSARAEKHRR